MHISITFIHGLKRNPHFIILLLPIFFFLFSCSSGNKEIIFYVSPDGDDHHPGTIEAPFRSIEKAQNAVRELKQKNEFPEGGVTVYLRGGFYPIRQTLRFTKDDSGRKGSPMTYKAYPGEEVRFIGGEVIGNFVPLADPDAKARIPASVRDKIMQADLKSQGITDYGVLKATGFGKPSQPTALELFFKSEPMTLARYPNNGGWMQIASVPQFGDTLLNEGGGGDVGSRFGIPVGRHYGRFKYEGDRPSTWTKNKDIMLQGFWTWDWADSYVKVKTIDVAKKEIIPFHPHGAYGYTQAQRYYALNILEELDSPGEWYLDREKGILFFWPPSPIEPESAVVSVLEDVMIHIDGAENLRIEGITFECSRGDAVKMDGGNDNLIGGCIIRNMGNNAIIIEGGTRNGVVGCDVYNMGDGGIFINGGDRKTLTPGEHYIVNNHIYRYSRINITLRPAIRIQGVGNTASHNHIHDSPHIGLLFNGNDHLLEYNEIHNIAKETGDVGAFYIGRNWTERGNVIRYNYFHHLHGPGLHGVMAVYLDDAASGTHIYGNVFYQAGRAAFVGGGHDNIVENNVFIECSKSIHLDARGMNWARPEFLPGGHCQMYEKLEEIKYDQPPYSVRYPELATILYRDPCMPRGNIFRTNLSYGGTWRYVEPDADEVTIENNYVLKEVPKYVNIEKMQFYPDNEAILEDMNFQKIPVDSIGLCIDQYRRSLPGK